MIKINGMPLKKRSTFPGGEIHVEIPELKINKSLPIVVETKLKSADDIIELMLVSNALLYSSDFNGNELILKCLYIPYARQDRVCHKGESFSLQVFVDLLNTLPFNKIICADVHSEIFFDLYRGVVKHITVGDIIWSRKYPTLLYHVIVSPDKGAIKRAELAAGGDDIVCFSKIRNDDGSISSNIVSNSDMIEGNDILIVDDICDGGGTFIELCKQLKKFNPKSISLYVTHGIFSKELDVLFDAGIKTIYTTNSFCELEPIKDRLVIWEI